MIRTVYLAGEITTDPDGYKERFAKAASDLRSRGYEVVDPCELDSPEESLEALSDPYGDKYEELLARDLKIIEDPRIEAVVVLPGWSCSKGANREVAKARELGKPVLSYPDLQPLWADAKPVKVEIQGTVQEMAARIRAGTLPTDSESRKRVPLASGCLDYFPAALAAVAEVSRAGNDKHNPGEAMHHARGKSGDHADCILRHLVDRGTVDPEDGYRHSAKVAWRALALLQEELEAAGAPLARGAKVS